MLYRAQYDRDAIGLPPHECFRNVNLLQHYRDRFRLGPAVAKLGQEPGASSVGRKELDDGFEVDVGMAGIVVGDLRVAVGDELFVLGSLLRLLVTCSRRTSRPPMSLLAYRAVPPP
jgi:hypothetical protein